MNQRCFILFLSALVLPLLAAGVLEDALVGGWKPIKDPKDPHVIEIAQFAVTAYNKQSKAELKFESVEKGETQVVSGTNYKLILVALDGKARGKYEAIVWEKLWQHFRNLTSFKPVK